MDLIDAQLRTVASESIAGYGWNNWLNRFPDREPELLGMTSVWSGNRSRLFVANADSSFAFISEVSVRGLNEIQRAEIPNNWRAGQMLSFQWENENETVTSLMLIDSRGRVLMFDAETLELIEEGTVRSPYVGSLQTDLEGDGDPELVVLLQRVLRCYSITSPLAVPQDRPDLMPFQLALSKLYPNPFNAQFNIEYQVPTAGRLTLNLYDLQGTKVAELVDKWQNTGSYKVDYHAQNLATGMYMIRLTTANESIVRKVVLIR